MPPTPKKVAPVVAPVKEVNKAVNKGLGTFSWMTLIVVITAVIVVIVGAIKVIQGDITYDVWVKQLVGVAVSAGVLGIGRGIRNINIPKS